MESLNPIFDFISHFVQKNNLDEKITFLLNLVIEELFTNMVKYNPENPNNIAINLYKSNKAVTITLVDFDAKPFDLNLAKEYDTHQPLQERTLGKIGIHFVKSMMDKIKYEYTNGQSKITLTKYLGNENV